MATASGALAEGAGIPVATSVSAPVTAASPASASVSDKSAAVLKAMPGTALSFIVRVYTVGITAWPVRLPKVNTTVSAVSTSVSARTVTVISADDCPTPMLSMFVLRPASV